jgi:hypothetical protein
MPKIVVYQNGDINVMPENVFIETSTNRAIHQEVVKNNKDIKKKVNDLTKKYKTIPLKKE